MHAKNRVVVSKIWITGYWLWSRLSYIATTSNQRRIVEIQLLASVGWKRGCQPFSCPCSLNVMHCRKERHVCLRNPLPPFLFGFRSIQSLPEAWGSWERQHAASALHYACIMPIPSLHLKIKTSLMQRSKGFGHGVVVSKICYVIYSDCVQDLDYRILIVLSVVTRGCCKPMNNCRDWAFRNIGLEVWLPAFQPPMFSKCDALPKGERFIWHVCLRNPFPPFLFGFRSLQSLPEAWGSWERQHAASALHYACIMPIPSLQLKIKTSLMQRSKGLGHGVVVSKICYVIYSDCVQDLDYRILIVLSVVTRGCCKPMNNCRDWAFRNIGLEVWLPAFQPPMFSKCDALPKGERFVWHVCLRNPFPPFLFWFRSLQSLPEAGFWEPQYVPPGLHYACIMPIPSLQLKIKTSLMQRSKGFGHGVVVSKICYNALIVLSIVLCDCCKRMNDCRDWAFRNIGLEVWLPAFQPSMFSKCDALPKGERFVWHVCLRNPFPPFLFWFRSLQSLPQAGFWEPQYVPPGLHYGCIMPIPSLQLQKKNLSHAGKQSSLGVVVSKICYNALIVLSIVLGDCCKRMNDCRDWAFSNIGLEEWLPAFQLLIFENKSINAEKRYVRNVCLGNPCLLWYQSLHSPPEAWGPWEPQYAPPVLHSCCIMPTPSLQLQKKDQSHAEKQRVWSRSCGLQELIVAIYWLFLYDCCQGRF